MTELQYRRNTAHAASGQPTVWILSEGEIHEGGSTTTARQAGRWMIGTFHGDHDGTKVVATAIRDDSAPLPYGWECTCGIGQRFPGKDGVWPSAWRHVHPPRWRARARRVPLLRRLVQPTARLQHPPDGLTG